MSTVTIEELGGKQRTLTLQGGGLPLQGAEWSGEQVLDTQWNPGSPVAVQHVMGPTEPPSDWNGMWRTTVLIALPVEWDAGTGAGTGAGTQSLVVAADVREAMDSIRVGAQLLRVTWIDKPGRRLLRYGRLSKLACDFDRTDDIKWSATFAWVGKVRSAVAVSQPDQGLAAARAAALAATDAQSRITAATIISSNAAIPNSANNFTLGNLEQLANGPRDIAKSFARALTDVTSRLQTLGNIIQTVANTPQAIAEQFVDAALGAVGVANEFVDEISRTSPESMSLRNSVKSLLSAATYYSSAQTGAEVLAEASMTAARAAQQRKKASVRAGSDPRSLTGAGDLLEVYVPRQGDTMTSISLKFYKTDLAYELARANGLPGSTITPPRGPALIIPTRQVLANLGP